MHSVFLVNSGVTGGPLGRCLRAAFGSPKGRPWANRCRTARGSTTVVGKGTPAGSPPYSPASTLLNTAPL
jgi:hypothetical protein